MKKKIQIPQTDGETGNRAFEEASVLMKFLLDEQLSPEIHRRLEEWFSKKSGKEIKIKAFLDFVEKEIRPNENPDSYEYQKFWEFARSLGITYPVKKPVRTKKTALRFAGRVAAVLIPALIVIGAYLWIGRGGHPEDIIVSVLEGSPSELLTLPDGSQVEIYGGSTLAYSREFGSFRNVSLSGSAMFRVKKSTTEENSALPFTVGTDNFSVTVLGTDFLVSGFPDDSLSSVSLYNGNVSVKAVEDTIFMVAGERLEYNKNTGNSSVTFIPSSEMLAGGYKPVLKFRNAALGEVLDALAAVFEVDIEISSGVDVKKGKHTVDLEGETLEDALKVLVTMNRNTINYKIDEDKVTITPKEENN